MSRPKGDPYFQFRVFTTKKTYQLRSCYTGHKLKFPKLGRTSGGYGIWWLSFFIGVTIDKLSAA